MTFQSILASTITVFLVVGIGCAARGVKIIDDHSEKSLMKLVIYILFPCFILSKVPGNPALQQLSVVGLAFLIGIATVVLSVSVCYIIGKLAGIAPEMGLGTFALATALQNYGFIPIPLIESIYPTLQSDRILGVLFIHNLGIETALWTVGIIVISGSAAGAWKRVINGPSVAIALGLLFNATGAWVYAPEILVRATRMVGVCAIPVSLIMVGATLAGVIEREKWQPNWRVIGLSVVLRYSVLPLLLIGFAWMIGQWGISAELKTILLIQAAMPCAIFPIVLARHFGGHPRVAVQVCLATSAASLVLTPLLLATWIWLLETPTV